MSEIFLFQGKVRFKQNQDTAYRLSEDAAWLSCAINKPQSHTALELGLGTAALALCTAYRNPNLKIHALEKQPEMLEAAVENIDLNSASVTTELVNINDYQSDRKFDISFANPPFYVPNKNSISQDKVKEHAHSFTDTILTDWLNVMFDNTGDNAELFIINHVMHKKELLSWIKKKQISLEYVELKTSATKGVKRFIAHIQKANDYQITEYQIDAYKEDIRNACLYNAQSIWDFTYQKKD